ncbi:hypothetical protein BFP71_14015 [Roseivirga misakiensis]|uniref:Uncharacterized protein n=2 Tax=Roseivirga misakiensis TaxID=1563681 RepID=A0A1E5SZP5_9BACT|nr:hypothetical protein BFP71_14015 [Roseivirga misakiensis]
MLKLMVDADNEAQQYQMSKHEFTDLAPKKNIVYSFKLEMFQGAPLVAPKTSLVAQDFIAVIKQSAKANELMQTATYAFELDKQFNLNVSISERVAQEEDSSEATEESESPENEKSTEE